MNVLGITLLCIWLWTNTSWLTPHNHPVPDTPVRTSNWRRKKSQNCRLEIDPFHLPSHGMLLPLAHCPVVTLPILTKGAAQSIIQISPGPTASQSDVLNMHLPNCCGFFAAETGCKKGWRPRNLNDFFLRIFCAISDSAKC